jgi:hypothetical protein
LSRKSGRKKKNRRGKPDEVINLGPIQVARFGRVILTRSVLDETGHDQFIAHVKQHRPGLKADIDRAISEVLLEIDSADKLQLCALMGTKTLADYAADISRSEDVGPPILEHFLSLCTAKPKKAVTEAVSEGAFLGIVAKLEKVARDTATYYSTETVLERYTHQEQEARLNMIADSLFVRGVGYPHHVKRTGRAVLKGLDDFLAKEYSMNSSEILEFFEAVHLSVRERLSDANEWITVFEEANKRFCAWNDAHTGESFTSIEDLMTAFDQSGLGATEQEIQAFRRGHEAYSSPATFVIRPGDEGQRILVEDLSIKFGQNSAFLHIEGFPGWPLNPSLTCDHPFILHESEFYCFDIASLCVDAASTLSNLARRKNPTAWLGGYAKTRDKAVEEETFELMKQVLNPSTCGRNLEYEVDGKVCEIDSLFVLDDAVVFVEAKAGGISDSARRGGTIRFKDDLKGLLGQAFFQGKRAMQTMRDAGRLHFRSRRDHSELELAASEFRHFFVVNVTLEPLFGIGTQLPLLRELGVLPGPGWPWVVCIDDLRAFVDILVMPCQMLHYITQRLSLNRTEFAVLDELEFLGIYLREGLHFTAKETSRFTKLEFNGYADDLNRYFNTVSGLLPGPCEKPAQKMPERVKLLIDKLDSIRPRGFISASISVLDCDSLTRDKIHENIIEMEMKSELDNRPHSATFTFKTRFLTLLCLLPWRPIPDIEAAAKRHFAENTIEEDIAIGWEHNLATTTKMRVWIFDRSTFSKQRIGG